jgi:WD40 repeat protein/predicted RNA-binding Zn-ribbon protein involved in translation (DUF1610 family)
MMAIEAEKYHTKLAKYFYDKPLYLEAKKKKPNIRKLVELPWLQTTVSNIQKGKSTIHFVLTDLRFIEAKYTAGMISALWIDYENTLLKATLDDSEYKIISDFSWFVRACSFKLLKRPDLVAQEALDFGQSSTLCDQAFNLLTQQGRGWMHRVRPSQNDETYSRCLQTMNINCSAISISPNGQYLVTVQTGTEFKSSIIKVWDIYKGTNFNILSGENVDVLSIKFIEMHFVIIVEKQKISVFDINTGLRCWEPLFLDSEIKIIEVSIKNEYIVVLDSKEQLSAWDLRNKRCHWIHKNIKYIRSISISPDELFVVTGGGEECMPGEIEIFRMLDGKHLSSIRKHEESVFCVKVLPNSLYVQTWSSDNKIRIWDKESKICLKTIPCDLHPDKPNVVSSDGRYTLYVGELRDRVLVWDIFCGAKPIILSGHTGSINNIVITPDGRFVATSAEDGTVRIWNFQHEAEQTEVEGHSYPVGSLAITFDKSVVSAAENLKIWNFHSSESPKTLSRHTGHTKLLIALPDCRRVLWNIPEQWTLMEKQIMVINIDDGTCENVLKGHTHKIVSIAVDPTGTFAFSGAEDDTIRMYDLRTFECVQVFPGGQHLCLSPDGRILVSLSPSTGLVIRGLPKGNLMWSDKNLAQARIAITPDATQLVIACEESMEMRNLESGQVLWKSESGTGIGNAVVLITPDGRFVVVKASDRNIKIFNSKSGREEHTIFGTNNGNVISLMPDGKHLVYCTDDAIKILDLESGTEVGCYLTCDPISSCDIGSDAQSIVGGSWTGHVYLLILNAFHLGLPIVTPWENSSGLFEIKKHEYHFGCPYCRVWSTCLERNLGIEMECPSCGKLVILKWFCIERGLEVSGKGMGGECQAFK